VITPLNYSMKSIIFDSEVIVFMVFSFPLEEFIYNYLITLSFYIIPKKGV